MLAPLSRLSTAILHGDTTAVVKKDGAVPHKGKWVGMSMAHWLLYGHCHEQMISLASQCLSFFKTNAMQPSRIIDIFASTIVQHIPPSATTAGGTNIRQ